MPWEQTLTTGLKEQSTILRYRLDSAHTAAGAALVEARRRVRLNEGQLRPSRSAAPLWPALG
jgi:hypothetical protein